MSNQASSVERAVTNSSLLDKIKQTPLVAAGAIGTVGALGYGLYTLGSGGSGLANAAGMGRRVVFQFGTVGAVIAYLAISGLGPFERFKRNQE